MEIARDLLASLNAHLARKEITLLIGPRQAGKTTLLKYLVKSIEDKGQDCHFFNLDIDTDAQYFASQSTFLQRLDALSGSRKNRTFVFIDEVQRIENAGLFLKGLYDRDLPYKFIATGSGSLELKEKIAESLVGRKQNFYLNTVSPEEFVKYRVGRNAAESIGLLRTDPLLEEKLLLEYLQYGGYPRVVTSATDREKTEVLTEIFQGYIERDIQLLLRLEKSRAFVTLLQLVANRAGQMTNYNNLAGLSGISVPTLKNYLWYSEKTFITEAVTPFFRNKEKEIVKSPQYYFLDSGLRNYLLGMQNTASTQDQIGFLFQQMIFRMLKDFFAGSVSSIHYWRTQNQAEVDFVVNTGIEVLPIEVKAHKRFKRKIGKSLYSFIEDYHPKEVWIVNRNLEEKMAKGETVIWFRPWYDLFKEVF